MHSSDNHARPLASPPREFKPQAYQCGSVDQYENKLRETQAELQKCRGELAEKTNHANALQYSFDSKHKKLIELQAELKAEREKIRALEIRIEQHRGALGYSVPGHIKDDPDIKCGLCEAKWTELVKLRKEADINWVKWNFKELEELATDLRDALEMYQTIAEKDCQPYKKQVDLGRELITRANALLNNTGDENE